MLEKGTRTTIVGMTGTGKTTYAVHLLSQSKQKWLIFDVKKDPKFSKLKAKILYEPDLDKLAQLWEDTQYVRFVPPAGSTAQELDDFLYQVFDNFSNFGVCIDELYSIHSNKQSGRGLQAVLTRGRSDKITLLGLTQRPRWISLFCLSEAECIVLFQVQLMDDRKRIFEIVGDEKVLSSLDKYSAWVYKQEEGINKIYLSNKRSE